MKILIFLGILFWSTLLIGQKSASFGDAKFAPPDGKKMLIIGQDLGSVGGLDDYSDGYVDNIPDHIPAGVTSYTSLPSLSGLTDKANWGAGDVRAQSYLEDETFENSFIVIGLYVVDQLPAIAEGLQDDAIRDLANWCKNQDRPVFIRFGYEFEGSWNNYNPTEFVDAWKHFVHVFDNENVNNVAYVWQSAGLNQSNIENWYPGDEYVNWMGYSHFQNPNPGQSIRAFAQEKNKPVMVAEATPRRDLKEEPAESHWSLWYKEMFDIIYADNNIKALAYINANWDAQPMWSGQGWGDSRIQVNEYVKEQWLIEMGKDPWIMASDSLKTQIDYEEWLLSKTREPEFNSEELIVIQQGNQLQLSTVSGKNLKDVLIYNLRGQLVFVKRFSGQTHRIEIQNMKNKIVVITAISDGEPLTKRIIIK